MINDIIQVFSPGRLNLIGEHTDHQMGLVVPACIDLGITFMAKARKDNKIKVYSTKFDEFDEFTPDNISKIVPNSWKNYIRGVVYNYQKIKKKTIGINIWIDSDLPIGAGMGSSASLELGIFKLLEELNSTKIDDLQAINACWVAENEFVGVKCGIMDQFIVRMGKTKKSLFINCENLDYEYLNLDQDMSILIIDTLKPRNLNQTSYNNRIHECKQALANIQSRYPKITSLSKMDSTFLKKSGLDGRLYMRASHVVNENQRVSEFMKLIRQNNVVMAGKLLYVTHNSLRNLFEVSWEEADFIVEISKEFEGIYGARMHGAGFGGSVILIINARSRKKIIRDILTQFKDRFGYRPKPYHCNVIKGTALKPQNNSIPKHILDFLN